MKLLSVNCGLPREVIWHGNPVLTSIYKEPVQGRIPLRTLNLDGDRQSDLSVHGGADKAVYCYPIEHYGYWRAELPSHELPIGVFGENFTIEGLDESSTHIGDRFSVGTAEVVVTQPRMPCYKLGIRFGMDDMVKRFLVSRRSGFYLKVSREGEVAAGDQITRLSADPAAIPVSEVPRLYIAKKYTANDVDRIRLLLEIEAFPVSWKEYFEEELERKSPARSF